LSQSPMPMTLKASDVAIIVAVTIMAIVVLAV
jgi:hypothetical protein